MESKSYIQQIECSEKRYGLSPYERMGLVWDYGRVIEFPIRALAQRRVLCDEPPISRIYLYYAT